MNDSYKPSGLYQRIYSVVRQVPEGQVASYGQVARITGNCSARQVGYAMSALPDDTDVPWYRIINSQGKISSRSGTDGHQYQRILLEQEGIVFDSNDKINILQYGWNGEDIMFKYQDYR